MKSSDSSVYTFNLYFPLTGFPRRHVWFTKGTLKVDKLQQVLFNKWITADGRSCCFPKVFLSRSIKSKSIFLTVCKPIKPILQRQVSQVAQW